MKVTYSDGRVEERSEEGQVERIVQLLRRLRDDYSDEIPDELVHSTSQDNKYKCRDTWFCCVRGLLAKLQKKGLISYDLAQKYERFEADYQSHKQKSFLTTAEDIQAANALIDGTIACLEARLDPSQN